MWQTRALELNNQDYWNWEKACALIDYAVTHQFNTIVVGQVKLFDMLVTPPSYSLPYENDHQSFQQYSRCVYLNRLAARCANNGITFYLQAKEFNFPMELLVAHPELLSHEKKIHFDADFWCAYLEDKVSLICEKIPALTGILIALSNTDSLLPISQPSWMPQNASNECNKRSLSLYNQCFNALYRATQKQNKHLVLRVFPADNHDLNNVLDAIRPLPQSVSVSIKLTPERFWPSFPNNLALQAVTERDVWVDIDLVGEEVCWGIFPFTRIEELQGRLLWCRTNPAVNGAVCKTSWEGVDNHSVIGTLSECNLVACSQMLIHGEMGFSSRELLRNWLHECYGWHPVPEIFAQFIELLEQMREVLLQVIYVRGHVFHRHSQVPVSYRQAVWSLYGQLNRSHWLPGASHDIVFDVKDKSASEERLAVIMSEKEQAKEAVTLLLLQAQRFFTDAALPATLAARWQEEWGGFELYCHLFIHAQKAFFTLHFAQQVENSWSMREICQVNIQELYRYATQMDYFCRQHPDYSFGLHVLFDASRVRILADSLSLELKSLK